MLCNKNIQCGIFIFSLFFLLLFYGRLPFSTRWSIDDPGCNVKNNSSQRLKVSFRFSRYISASSNDFQVNIILAVVSFLLFFSSVMHFTSKSLFIYLRTFRLYKYIYIFLQKQEHRVKKMYTLQKITT